MIGVLRLYQLITFCEKQILNYWVFLGTCVAYENITCEITSGGTVEWKIFS